MTPRQDRFVQEYLIDLNATQAAMRAGYSERTANEQGAQLLGKPEIAAAVNEAKAERADRAQVDALWVLRRLVDELEADLTDLFDDDGNLLPVKQWPKIWRQGLVLGLDVEEIEQDGVRVGTLRKVRLDNRVKRLELIGKHVNVSAFRENHNHTGLDGLAERLDRAHQRGRV